MSQLSKPYQYALIAMLVLAGAWFTVLKPSDDAGVDAPLPATPAATAPGVQGLTTAVDKAKTAVDPSTSVPKAPAAPSPPTATSAVPTTPAAKPAEKPTTTTGDPSRPILAAVGDGKVAVVLFYENEGADDRAIRRTLKELPRRGGRVAVFSAPIADVGRYAAITRGVSVLSAPTVLVIGADRVASAITGYTEVGEIDQLVGDALKRTVSADATPAVPGAA